MFLHRAWPRLPVNQINVPSWLSVCLVNLIAHINIPILFIPALRRGEDFPRGKQSLLVMRAGSRRWNNGLAFVSHFSLLGNGGEMLT